MKNYFKFTVVVFGVTLAIIGSADAKALTAPDSIRCEPTSDKGCVRVNAANGSGWLIGTKVTVGG